MYCTGIPGENREQNVLTFYVSCCEMPSMAERSLRNKPDDQLSLCTLTDNGHKRKLNELRHSVANEPNNPLWSSNSN